MQLSSWGRYPRVDSKLYNPQQIEQAQQLLTHTDSLIARGLGRSYGDSALAAEVLQTKHFNKFISFDQQQGIVHCAAGVSLDDILQVFVPKGWMIPVTPGTKFVTVGGAIASDVHGKNHHINGCFSQHVLSLELMLATGEIVHCSAQSHRELFLATCAGMGLTGIIISACIQLRAISSAYIKQTTYKTRDLQHTLECFNQQANSTYSVAWIDCLATGEQLGRSLLMTGEHSSNGDLSTHQAPKLAIPFATPSFMLNKYSITAFNQLYYAKTQKAVSHQHVHYNSFFYPLDGIKQWNNMYGRKGFVQYQFVIPMSAGLEGLQEILATIAASKKGSFLAVLKVFGSKNDNYLSFPIPGYSLALDFKVEPGIFNLLQQLDELVLKYQGRLYLTKDARMSEDTFKQSYPNWQKFAAVREQYHLTEQFQSAQSKRLGL